MKKSTHHTLARSAGVFTGATLISRILGYVRDSLVANYFGAGAAADAFYAAFRISNLFRRLLGEGALSASFIPVFAQYCEKEGEAKTKEFFQVMWTTLASLLLVITVLGIVFAPQITTFIAMGFERTPERFQLTVDLTRAMFPFLLFISLAALVTGVLNAFRIFFLPAVAPASLSLAEIGYLLMLAPALAPDHQILGLALSVVVGGAIQLFAQIPALWKKGFRLVPKWDWSHPGMRRVTGLMLPATLGLSVDQLNAFVDTICASYLAQGSVTALYYSNRVMQLPLALFGIALSQVSLPTLAAHVAKGELEEVKDTLNFALRLTLFMIVPATVGLIVLGEPIVRMLFQHGEFTAEATTLTNHALLFFSLGLLAYASVKILASAFYAFQNTRTPVRVAAGCVFLNIALSLVLMRPMGVGGLALATALSSWANAVMLFLLLRKKLGLLGGRRVGMTLVKALLASAMMAAVCLALMQALQHFPHILRVLVAMIGGALAYLAAARALRMEEWAPFWAQMKRT